MNIWKKLAVVSAVTLSLTATSAWADDDVAVIAHVSASVSGNLAIHEISALNFGNMTVTSCTPCAGDAKIVMTDEGTRTLTNGSDTLVLMNGITQTGLASGTNFETGSQRPGFYDITTTDDVTNATTSNVYVSFADITGDIIDTAYDPLINGGGSGQTHPNNYVTLSNPTAGNCFKLNQFTFETDTGAAANGHSGYTVASAHTTDIYGSWVPVTGGQATLRVGGTLTTLAGCTLTPGQYTGTFYVMVAY
jgi:hypothetical protein